VNQSNTKGEEAAEAPLVFLSKAQVLKKVSATWPTVWKWCREGRFPKPRALGPNKTVWLEHEVNDWIRAQPIRKYKPIT
jgi:prophage regulatory protein